MSVEDETKKLIKEPTLAKVSIERTRSNLLYAQTQAIKSLGYLIAFGLLKGLSWIVKPFSLSAAKRLNRSAQKRIALRIDFTNKSDDYIYQKILDRWEKDRLKNIGGFNTNLLGRKFNSLISIIIPLHKVDSDLLDEMIYSVISQYYLNWELFIACDKSIPQYKKDIIDKFLSIDKRIKICYTYFDGYLSEMSNSALNLVNGEYIAVLDQNDILQPDALFHVAGQITANPNSAIIYTDEDKIDIDGRRYDPHFKPDWNRDLLYSHNYISHFCVLKTSLVRASGGFRRYLEGAHDYDLLLRVVEMVNDEQIFHIPKVLYSRRAAKIETEACNVARPYAQEAGRRALMDHLCRTHDVIIDVIDGLVPLTYRPIWPIIGAPMVSIIIPTRDHLDITKVAVYSIINKTDYQNFEILIIDNGSVLPSTISWFTEISAQDERVRVIRDERPFNYSALNNVAVLQAKGEFLALLNNDIEVINSNWLDEMLSLSCRPKTGCVGAKLLYPNGQLQHGGIVIGLSGVAGHSHKYAPRDSFGYFGRLQLRQSYSAVTGACLVVRKEIFLGVGGLDEELAIAFNDVDFCLKVRAAGFNNVWTPYAVMYHHESISRGLENTPQKKARFKKEKQLVRQRWQIDIYNDPFYNTNLSLDFEDFRFRY